MRRLVAAAPGCGSVRRVHSVTAYLLEGDIDRQDAGRIARDLLADPIEDLFAVGDRIAGPTGAAWLTITRKRGVTDPVTASVVKGAADLGLTLDRVKRARMYAFEGDAGERTLLEAARRLLANEVVEEIHTGRAPLQVPDQSGLSILDSRMSRPSVLGSGNRKSQIADRNSPRPVTVPVREATPDQLERTSREGCLSLSVAEMQAIADHFRSLGRDPTDLELETFAQTWSEHCKHKTLTGRILYRGGDEVAGELAASLAAERADGGLLIDNLLASTIVRATRRLDRSWCLSVFADNAGIVAFDDETALAIKVETHNHPSALEPYGGAGTGIGGVIRDVLGAGLGAWPIACTDVFCVGPLDLDDEDLPPGCLHPARVLAGVVAGVADYGNRMGIPTVAGAVLTDPLYTGNPLVFCGTVGIMPRSAIAKEPRPGDLIYTLGGATGRDGIHGATFSSIELSTESENLSGGAVQIGDPITEKKVADALMKARDLGLYDAVTDCGAGGYSSAIGEMGQRLGARVELASVPLKYQGLGYREIWISEAQERMVLSVPPEHAGRLEEVCAEEDVAATRIGEFTSSGRLEVFYEETRVGDLDLEFLHRGVPVPLREARWQPPALEPFEVPSGADPAAALLALLAAPITASKEPVVRRYDHSVQGASVLEPFAGRLGEGPGDAAVLAPRSGSHVGLALSCGINPYYARLDPYWMAACAVDEAIRNLVAVGASTAKISLLDNFAWGDVDDPQQLGALVRAAAACADFAIAFGAPFVSGKDSLHNSFRPHGGDKVSVLPTLLVTGLGIVDDVRGAVSSDLKRSGSRLWIIGETHGELGGSGLARLHGALGDDVPRVRPREALASFRAVEAAIGRGLALSVHDLSEGGLAVAAAEMVLGGGLGARLDLERMPAGTLDDPWRLAFGETPSRFLVEVDPACEGTLAEILAGVAAARIGEVVSGPQMVLEWRDTPFLEVEIAAVRSAFASGLGFLEYGAGFAEDDRRHGACERKRHDGDHPEGAGDPLLRNGSGGGVSPPPGGDR